MKTSTLLLAGIGAYVLLKGRSQSSVSGINSIEVDRDDVIEMLRDRGINPVGSYANLPDTIIDAVEDIKLFGWNYWKKRTTMGGQIEEIIREITRTGIGSRPGNVTLKMKDTLTGQTIYRTIDGLNAYSENSEGYVLKGKKDQRKNLERWIEERGNAQHETVLKLISWEFELPF